MRRQLSLGFGLFVLGLFLGLAIASLLLGYQVDELTLVQQELQAKLAATEEELSQVKDKLARGQRPLITAVETHVKLKAALPSAYEAESIRLELEEKAKALLAPWRGREVRAVDHLGLSQVFSGRLLEAGGQLFLLDVELIVVSEKLSVYLNATPRPARPLP